MGNLFVDDYDTEGDLRAGARRRERAFDELDAALPGTEDAERVALEARRAGSRYETDLMPGASAWETGGDYDARAEADALDRLAALSRGGFTDADRAMMDATARREEMSARADREAMLQNLEARGMGSSGASLAAGMMAGEAATGRSADAYSNAMAAAQARAYDALSAYGSLGSHAADRNAGLESSRMSALDAWNAAERDRRAGVAARNTERRRSDEDAYGDARQRWWENRFASTTARTGTAERDDSRLADQRNREEDRDAEREDQVFSAVGNIGGGMAGLGG